MADSTETMTQDGAAPAGHKNLLLKTYCVSSGYKTQLPPRSHSHFAFKSRLYGSYQIQAVRTPRQLWRCPAAFRFFPRLYSWKTE